jgi:DNA-binding NtrC family response regulator
MPKILIADDDPAMVAVLSEVLKENRYDVIPATTPERAVELAKEIVPDLVLTDIEMPKGKLGGFDVLQQVKEFNSSIPVIMITGQASKDRVVKALRGGVHDFVEKPFQLDELLKRVENAVMQTKTVRALQENAELKNQLRTQFRIDNMVGHSAPMEAVYRMIERVANTESTILVLGESGTGKELVARALHYNSRRAMMPFVAVNCAALPEHLLESELFGHRKGAFTGAAYDKVGLFQHADGGTIFLDEIGSMALGLQTKLLRFLQDKELRRVGDNGTIKVDVRVVAATNEPLQEKIKAKSFREDLFYRISVIPIQLPPLRSRVEDIPELAAFFLQGIAERHGVVTPHLPEAVMDVLKKYTWPGNVRELQNAMERACALCDAGIVALRDLPEKVVETVLGQRAPADPCVVATPVATATVPDSVVDGASLVPRTPAVITQPLKEFLHHQEAAYIERAIAQAGGNKERAADILGISMATLYRKLPPAHGGQTVMSPEPELAGV